MKYNYFYAFILVILSLSTMVSTSAFGWIPKSLTDTVETKEVRGTLVDTRINKPKEKSLIIFKPFAPYTLPIKANKENNKTLSNVKVYPNPVFDEINLTFQLNKEIAVSIKIMDALGNEINTLLSQRLAEGNQVQNFNLKSSLSSGYYFIRIMAGSETVVKRIQIL